jgi:hypothetical protein
LSFSCYCCVDCPIIYLSHVTASHYNSLTGLQPVKITVTAAVIYIFTSHFLVIAPNSVLCKYLYWLVNIPELTHCSNCPTLKVKFEVTVPLAVYCQSVYLGIKLLENHGQRLIFQLNHCGYSTYVTPSLMRSLGLSLMYMLVLLSSVHIKHIACY